MEVFYPLSQGDQEKSPRDYIKIEEEKGPWPGGRDIPTFRGWEIRRNPQVRLKKSGQ